MAQPTEQELGALEQENADLRAENELLRRDLDRFYRPGWATCTAAAGGLLDGDQ